MKEKMLHDFLKETGRAIYPEFTIEDITCAGEWVMFREVQDVLYVEHHMIPMLDVLAWMYIRGLK